MKKLKKNMYGVISHNLDEIGNPNMWNCRHTKTCDKASDNKGTSTRNTRQTGVEQYERHGI